MLWFRSFLKFKKDSWFSINLVDFVSVYVMNSSELNCVYQGTSADQDTRFSNKQAKLMKSQKFAPELEHLVRFWDPYLLLIYWSPCIICVFDNVWELGYWFTYGIRYCQFVWLMVCKWCVAGGHDEGEHGCYASMDCFPGNWASRFWRWSSYQLHLWSFGCQGKVIHNLNFFFITFIYKHNFCVCVFSKWHSVVS